LPAADDEAQERLLLYANVSRANSTVWTHWGATVRTLEWAMILRSRMLVPDELTNDWKFCRKCGKEHRKEGHAKECAKHIHSNRH